jgi:P27 family predicted phage terminase small subunit
MKRNPTPTACLSDGMKTFYRQIGRKYRLSEHHRRLLLCACQAHSRMEQAQAVVEAEGLTTTDRHGQARPHPAIQIEMQSRTAFMRAVRELGLQDEAPADSRPPILRGRYREGT